MSVKDKSIAEVLRTKFEEQNRETRGEDLLDLISSKGPRTEGYGRTWLNLGRRPRSEEIKYQATTDEMILDGNAVLKDGRRIYWE